MQYLIISGSLSKSSRSRELANSAFEILKKNNQSVQFLDLQKTALPPCDGDSSYSDPMVLQVKKQIKLAKGILIASPIYNYDVNSAVKNLVELTGQAWREKVVGFMCAAGGKSSYMSIMPFANSLMLDFRTVIIPRFVFATGSSFSDNTIIDTEILSRIEELTSTLKWFTEGLFNSALQTKQK
ncbi:MAG: NADPH-dependent FMN reductase [Calditrichaceae bacterium]